MKNRFAMGTYKVSKYGTFTLGMQQYFSDLLIGHKSPDYFIRVFTDDSIEIVDAKGRLIKMMRLTDFISVDAISGQYEVMSGGWLVVSFESKARYLAMGISSRASVKWDRKIAARARASEQGKNHGGNDNSPFYKVDVKKCPVGRMVMLLYLNNIRDFRVIDSKGNIVPAEKKYPLAGDAPIRDHDFW